jgi:hypothetical protein
MRKLFKFPWTWNYTFIQGLRKDVDRLKGTMPPMGKFEFVEQMSSHMEGCITKEVSGATQPLIDAVIDLDARLKALEESDET